MRLTSEGRAMIEAIVQRFADGESNEEIAVALGIPVEAIQFLLTLEDLSSRPAPD